jgi:CRP-like cAMP-binding protein
VIEGLVEAQKEQNPLARISPIEVEKIWQALAATSIVDRLPGEQLRRLFSGCEPWAVEAKALVARAGSRDEYLYILVSGSVEARLTVADGRTFDLKVFLPGDVFGERSLLEHLPWPADYVARERSKFVRVNKEGLARAMTGNPDPRGMLDALRAKHFDRDVAAAAEKLQRAGGA